MSIIFFKRAYVVFADAPFLRIFSLFVHVSYLSLEIHDTCAFCNQSQKVQDVVWGTDLNQHISAVYSMYRGN